MFYLSLIFLIKKIFFFFCSAGPFSRCKDRAAPAAMHGLLTVGASHCGGFSLRGLLLLPNAGSRCSGFRSCGAWAQLPHSTWNPPGPRIELVSPALEAAS